MSEGASNVVYPSFVTRLDIPADRIVSAIPSGMKGVVVMGYDADGEEYFASSVADGGSVLWLMERMKMALLAVGDDE